MPLVLGLLIVLFVLVGVPMLCRMLLRRMAASPGLRGFLNAYGPRFPGGGPGEPDEETDGPVAPVDQLLHHATEKPPSMP